jgi:hypothetical protein
MSGPVPVDIVELIKSILAYEEQLKREEVDRGDGHMERAYIYDYAEEIEKEQEKPYKVEIQL